MLTFLIIYFVIFLGFSLLSLYDEFNSNFKWYCITSNLLSIIFIASFILIYLGRLSPISNLLLTLMLVIGIGLEIYSSTKEVNFYKENPDTELSDNENLFLVYGSLIFVNLITIPGYVIGFILL